MTVYREFTVRVLCSLRLGGQSPDAVEGQRQREEAAALRKEHERVAQAQVHTTLPVATARRLGTVIEC